MKQLKVLIHAGAFGLQYRVSRQGSVSSRSWPPASWVPTAAEDPTATIPVGEHVLRRESGFIDIFIEPRRSHRETPACIHIYWGYDVQKFTKINHCVMNAYVRGLSRHTHTVVVRSVPASGHKVVTQQHSDTTPFIMCHSTVTQYSIKPFIACLTAQSHHNATQMHSAAMWITPLVMIERIETML